MKKIGLIVLFLTLILAGCKKDNGSRLSGTDTIDNRLYGNGPYYALGFSFPDSKKISTLKSPVDVFTINVFPDNLSRTYFAAQNFNDSFYLSGIYADAAAAALAFKNLTSFTVTQWSAIGDAVKSNQIWLFRTSSDTYAKFRIISNIAEIRDNKPYVECTFEWMYQPDGSLTFPGK